MKKQLLIAAVAASMTSVAMADISISGAAKVNNNDAGTSMEADLKVAGKSGDTSVVAMIALDNGDATSMGPVVEQLYVTTSIAGVGVKAGTWKGGKSELTQATGNDAHRYNISTSFGGVKLSYEDKDSTTAGGASSSSSTISGTVGGIAISHKSTSSDASETKAAGTVGGVAAKMHQVDDGTDTNTSVTLSTSVQGINLTYVDVKADATTATDAAFSGTAMDGFFGKHSGVKTANGFGISTDIAGNKVTFKTMDMVKYGVNTATDAGTAGAETTTKKVIVTRKLTSGATFEATYVNGATANTLDLELAVKF
jgi:hypothetical protein